MKTAVLNIKIDPKVKREAQKVARDLGFSLSSIINASLKELTRRKVVSYTLHEPTPLLKEAIDEARKERAKGNFYGPFDTQEKAIRFLKSK